MSLADAGTSVVYSLWGLTEMFRWLLLHLGATSADMYAGFSLLQPIYNTPVAQDLQPVEGVNLFF